ncbi:peptidoglycan-recognition protein SC1a-like [Lytechinus variegatus]|uniref:peptidoglycan-recognition protein SC1a-like n=1 Tax=Lytechinus variegatus TaxID=7654 RepID=UPI001BB10C0B|nr:peptidoglycan-recognition protein SC1a-like [Lytechinus variegatus]
MLILSTMGSLRNVLISICALAILVVDCHGNVVEKRDVSEPSTDPVVLQPIGTYECPNIISRSEWGARSPKSTTALNAPLEYAVVHHTDGSRCYDETSCKAIVRGIQNYHMDSNKWDDIGYNFLIGDDLNVYEGRGWNNKGAHSVDYNAYSIGICMIGTFTSTTPTSQMMGVLQQFLDCALSRNTLMPGYTLYGHRQATSTTCPGEKLYSALTAFRHYRNTAGSQYNPLDGEQCSI